MAASNKTWVNNNPPSCEDDDLNGFQNENNNLIEGTGQTLDTGDNQQTHKAAAVYSTVGDFYVDSGVVNAYVVDPISNRVAPPVLLDGMRFRFKASTPNTTSSPTINVSGFGVKLVLDINGGAVSPGQIADNAEVMYDSANDRFILTSAPIAPSIVTEGWAIGRPISRSTGQTFDISALAGLSVTTLRPITFSTDGTKMFAPTNQGTMEFSLLSGFDLGSGYALAGEVFPGSTNEQLVRFNTDGTKMFVLDVFDIVTEYSLSVGFDPRTATATGNSFNFTATAGGATSGLTFNTDGTRMYIKGNSTTVYEYSISTGFDLGSTVAYTGNSFDTNGQITSANQLAFNPDGTKMFVLDGATNSVYEYSLSTGFDLGSTVAYTGNSFDFTTQTATPQGLAFNPEGTVLYVTDGVNDIIYEYSISTGFDLGSTVAYTGDSFSTEGQDTELHDVQFNTDGTKMFVLGDTNDTVYEYILTVPYNIDLVYYAGNSFSVNSQESNARGLAFNTDGTRMYVCGTTTDTVYEYSLSVGFDLSSTVAYTGNSFSVTSELNSPHNIRFNTDGTKMFLCGASVTDRVYEYSLSVGFDLGSTVAYTGNSFDGGSQEATVRALAFNDDGTAMLLAGHSEDTVYEYSISTGFDLGSTVAYTGNSFDMSNFLNNPDHTTFSVDGTKMFVTVSGGVVVYSFNTNFVRVA